MTETEHLLDILIEECAEVIQRVTKAKRFGLLEIQSEQSLTNQDRIIYELNDVIATANLLLCDKQWIDEKAIQVKREKVARYLKYSAECGTLTQATTQPVVPSDDDAPPFVSPVTSSTTVKAKYKVGGKVAQPVVPEMEATCKWTNRTRSCFDRTGGEHPVETYCPYCGRVRDNYLTHAPTPEPLQPVVPEQVTLKEIEKAILNQVNWRPITNGFSEEFEAGYTKGYEAGVINARGAVLELMRCAPTPEPSRYCPCLHALEWHIATPEARRCTYEDCKCEFASEAEKE